MFVSVKDSDKPHILQPVKTLAEQGFKIVLLTRLNGAFTKVRVMVPHDPNAAACAGRTVMLDKGSLAAKA